MSNIITFGEIMLRLAPYNYERLAQSSQLQATYGGGEANVAVSLSCYGHNVHFVTRLPKNPLGDAAFNSLRKYGVNTDFIVRGGERLGLYFLEHGASIRPSRVTYDRAHSAISQIKKSMLDWTKILKDQNWFHVTGITPALSESAAEVTIDSVKTAKEMGATVSCDLNYRNKLWSRERAKEIMTEVVKYVDIVIGNEEDASDVFGIEEKNTNVTSGELSLEHYKKVASAVQEYSNCDKVAITLRESISASDNNWSALLYDGTTIRVSKKYPIHLIDRVGGGDSFSAGLINGLLRKWNDQDALEFAVAASALKQTIPGDMNLVSEDEVLQIVKGDLSGRIRR